MDSQHEALTENIDLEGDVIVSKALRKLRFPTNLERMFLEDYFSKSLLYLRFVIFLGSLVYGSFCVFDYLIAPEMLSKTMVVRLGIVVPIGLFIFAMTYTKYFKKYMQEFVSFFLLVMGLGAIANIMITPTPASYIYFAGLFIIIIACFSVARLRFWYATFVAWSLFIAYLIMAIRNETPFSTLIGNSFIFANANLLGMVGNYFMEYYVRIDYLRSLQLEVKKNKAEEATRIKDKFVSLVSHDLRSPLSSMREWLWLLIGDKTAPLNVKHKELVGRLEAICGGLLEMIDNLLDISRLKSGQIILKPKFFDSHTIAANVIDNLSLQAEKKNIELINEVSSGTRIYADYDLFYEVLQNLVSNAIKFCNKGNHITIFTPKNQSSTIAVWDTGVGIPEKLLPDLFKHEVKTSLPGTAGETGTGLGLPLCKDIMEAHNGSIKVESIVDEGTVFFANLPEIRTTILIIDDQDAARLSMKKILDKLNVDIIEAENGKVAIDIIQDNTPHLVITDKKMPEMDGLTFLKNFRANPQTKDIPVIFVTSSTDMETKITAIKLGANDFITKPIFEDDFIPRVKRFIG